MPAKKQSHNSHSKNLRLALWVLCILVIIALFHFVIKKKALINTLDNRTVVQVQQNEEIAPEENFRNNNFQLRNFNINDDGKSLESLPQNALEILLSVPDSELIGLACNESFVNNSSGKFFYRPKDSHELFTEIKDPVYANIIESLKTSVAADSIIISGRICDTSDDRIVLEYNVSDDNESDYLIGKNITTYYSVFPKNELPQSTVILTRQPVWPYAGCNPALELTTEGDLYVSCGIAVNDSAQSLIYKINLGSGVSDLVSDCKLTFTPEPAKSCEQI